MKQDCWPAVSHRVDTGKQGDLHRGRQIYSLASDVESFCVSFFTAGHILLSFSPSPSIPLWQHGKYVVSMLCYYGFFQSNGAATYQIKLLIRGTPPHSQKFFSVDNLLCDVAISSSSFAETVSFSHAIWHQLLLTAATILHACETKFHLFRQKSLCTKFLYAIIILDRTSINLNNIFWLKSKIASHYLMHIENL